MQYEIFLDAVIKMGIEGASISYANDAPKLKGAKAGFEACRNLQPAQLVELYVRSEQAAVAEMRADKDIDKYWELRCFAAEVEWTCNCVSAAQAHKPPLLSWQPTARAYVTVAKILGVNALD